MFISTAFVVSPCLILFCIICGMVCIKWQSKQTETETETGILSPFEECTSDIERNCFLGERKEARRNMKFRKKTTTVFKWMNKRERDYIRQKALDDSNELRLRSI